MKKLLFSVVLGFASLTSVYAQEEDEFIRTDYYNFESWNAEWGEPLKEAVIFADACKLRSHPTSGSETLAKLLIGDKVKILQVSKTDTTINGITSSWIHVESNKKKGYVWGGLLTNQALKVNDTTFAVWGVSKIIKGSDTVADKYFTSIRLFSRKQVRKQVEFEVTHGDQPGYAELLMMKNPLIDGVEHVFVYHTLSEACGVAASDHYVMETENKMSYLGSGYAIGEAALFHSSSRLVFPTKEKEHDYNIPYHYKPEKNQVLRINSHDEYGEDCVWTERTTVESFEWKEGVFVPFCRE